MSRQKESTFEGVSTVWSKEVFRSGVRREVLGRPTEPKLISRSDKVRTRLGRSQPGFVSIAALMSAWRILNGLTQMKQLKNIILLIGRSQLQR